MEDVEPTPVTTRVFYSGGPARWLRSNSSLTLTCVPLSGFREARRANHRYRPLLKEPFTLEA